MVELLETNAFAGLVPFKVAGAALSEVDLGRITAIQPFQGQTKAVSAALKDAHGVTFPAPNRATGKAGLRCIWTGRGQAFLCGPALEADLDGLAGLTDQSDGWVGMQLQGPKAEDVLARLMPLDLRASKFKRGHSARSQCLHVPVSITRVGADAFTLLAFRSLARVLAHDLGEAMRLVEARWEAL